MNRRTGLLLLSLFLLAYIASAQQDMSGLSRNGPVYSGWSPGKVEQTAASPKALTLARAASVGGVGPRFASVAALGAAATPSGAQSVAINGNYAYVCDLNDISTFNVSNPATPVLVSTVTATMIQNAGAIKCAIRNGALAVFSDQGSSADGNTPGFLSFSLTNPQQPQLIQATSINKRFWQPPVYIGNYAYVPISSIFGFGFVGSDLISFDFTNANQPTIASALVNNNSAFGGEIPIFGAVQADSTLLYIGTTSVTNASPSPLGLLKVIDVSNPASMKVVGQRTIPGTAHFYAPILEGTTAVGLGITGGYPFTQGAGARNIVVTVLDVSDPRGPGIYSINTTSYKPGTAGSGATGVGGQRIGTHLFAFSGVLDATNNPVLLFVDTTNPAAPVLSSQIMASGFSSMQAVGTTLYATLGTGALQTYSIPGVSNDPPALSCPAFTDTILVVDRSSGLSGQAFLDAKAALKSFIDKFHTGSDQVGVASFTNVATLDQQLTGSFTSAKSALDSIVTAGDSYLGSGIDAAKNELLGSRSNALAAKVMVILSDGADRAATLSGATLSAATAAKAAGIRIVSVQYGSGSNTLMQAVASSTSDYYSIR